MSTESHIARVLWACDCAEHVLDVFEKDVPGDMRPRAAIEAGRNWASGGIPMTRAREAAFSAHEAARDAKADGKLRAEKAARAAGHAAATAHVATHAPHAAKYALAAAHDKEAELAWQNSLATN